MSLWGNKRNAVKKHSIIDVIRYEGPNDVLVWKFPSEDFNNNAQLIVGPSQEAIFIKNGQVHGSFKSGTHQLNTQNYPFLRALVGLVSGGISPFQCSVYYINKTVSMGILWGTDSPISMIDPLFQVATDVRCNGDFSIRVENGHKLMEKLVGATIGFSHEEITKYFGQQMATQVRGMISAAMINHQLSTIGIDPYLSSISQGVLGALRPVFEPFGIALEHFTIASITATGLEGITQEQREQKIRMITTEGDAAVKMKMADAQYYENKVLDISEKQKGALDVAKTLAGNPGPKTAMGSGLGFSGVIGGTIVQPSAAGTEGIVRMVLNPTEPPAKPDPLEIGIMPGSMASGFMEEAPTPPAKGKSSFEERVDKAMYMLEKGMISQEEFERKKQQLLDEI